MKKHIAFILIACLLPALFGCGGKNAPAAEAPATVEAPAPAEKADAPGSDVVILFTNDIHCGVNDNLGVTGLAAVKDALEAAGRQVLLVDCGDAVQGDSIGTLSEGEYIIDLMNELGYAVATPGNHEFDYTMEQFLRLRERAEFPYVSANFTDAGGATVLEPYVLIEADGAKIAFVGVSTPQTPSTSTPAYFQNENGEYIYGFCQGDSGEAFYAAVQDAVDAARAEGADYVFLLAHLGIEAAAAPYMSTDLITHTTGVDAVLDGHSHSVLEGEGVKNAEGKSIPLASTGTKLQNIGCLCIGKDGGISVKLINAGGVGPLLEDINAEFDALVNTTLARSDTALCITDPATGLRMVRSNETNLGDLCTDAYRAATGADIAFVNGGGVRSDIPAGEVTYGQLLAVHPFGNELCMVEASGQEILDALELSASQLPGEFGGFLQVSGLSFTIDLSVDSTVVTDADNMFVSVEGERRVKDVLVGGEPLDPEKVYRLASHDNMLQNRGDGYTMFADNVFLLDRALLDSQVLIDYLASFPDGMLGEEYADPYGQGRITIIGG